MLSGSPEWEYFTRYSSQLLNVDARVIEISDPGLDQDLLLENRREFTVGIIGTGSDVPLSSGK